MADKRVKFSIATSPSLKSWLEAKSRWIPHESGPGKRPGENLGRYVEMILTAHRQQQPAEVPVPPPLPPEDQSVLDAIRALRERQPQTFDAILLLAEEAGRTPEAAEALVALAVLVRRIRSARGRAGTVRR